MSECKDSGCCEQLQIVCGVREVRVSCHNHTLSHSTAPHGHDGSHRQQVVPQGAPAAAAPCYAAALALPALSMSSWPVPPRPQHMLCTALQLQPPALPVAKHPEEKGGGGGATAGAAGWWLGRHPQHTPALLCCGLFSHKSGTQIHPSRQLCNHWHHRLPSQHALTWVWLAGLI